MKRILIIDEMYPAFEPLKKAGYVFNYVPKLPRADILMMIRDYEGLMVRTRIPVDKEMLDRATNLKFIARAGAGLDNIDMDEAARRGIKVFHAAEGNQNAVAEHALGMLLALFNKFKHAQKQLEQLVWDREANRAIELSGRTVGIVGYGHMGSAFASKCALMGAKVIAYDKYKFDFNGSMVKEVSEKQLFEQAEVVSFHLPLTDETNQAYDAAYFRQFTNPLFVINTARGKIIKLQDMPGLLADGTILAAGLDVLENEKPETFTVDQRTIFNSLLTHPRVILSPHVAGWSQESYRRITEVLVRKILENQ